MSRSRAIVVVAYGGIEFLKDALAPLGAENVIVVDNSSSSLTRDLVVSLGHTYLDPGANLGFASGVNVGLRHLAAEGVNADVLLLNPDARIEPSNIDILQDALTADPKLAAVAPSLVNEAGDAQLTRYPLPAPGQVWRFTFGLPRGRRERDHLIGASLLLRAEAVADIGEFDEHYFLYGEEVDWQRRAFENGWEVAEVSAATALHHGGKSSDDDSVRIARVSAGQESYVHRWHGAWGSASVRLGGWVALMLRSRSASWGSARYQAYCFGRGPRRVAPLPPSPVPLSVVHLVRRSTYDEAKRLAEQQTAAGDRVTVAKGLFPALRAVRTSSTYDVVHAHGGASVLIACTTGAWHGARVAASPDRGRALLIRRRVDLVLPNGATDYRRADQDT